MTLRKKYLAALVALAFSPAAFAQSANYLAPGTTPQGGVLLTPGTMSTQTSPTQGGRTAYDITVNDPGQAAVIDWTGGFNVGSDVTVSGNKVFVHYDKTGAISRIEGTVLNGVVVNPTGVSISGTGRVFGGVAVGEVLVGAPDANGNSRVRIVLNDAPISNAGVVNSFPGSSSHLFSVETNAGLANITAPIINGEINVAAGQTLNYSLGQTGGISHTFTGLKQGELVNVRMEESTLGGGLSLTAIDESGNSLKAISAILGTDLSSNQIWNLFIDNPFLVDIKGANHSGNLIFTNVQGNVNETLRFLDKGLTGSYTLRVGLKNPGTQTISMNLAGPEFVLYGEGDGTGTLTGNITLTGQYRGILKVNSFDIVNARNLLTTEGLLVQSVGDFNASQSKFGFLQVQAERSINLDGITAEDELSFGHYLYANDVSVKNSTFALKFSGLDIRAGRFASLDNTSVGILGSLSKAGDFQTVDVAGVAGATDSFFYLSAPQGSLNNVAITAGKIDINPQGGLGVNLTGSRLFNTGAFLFNIENNRGVINLGSISSSTIAGAAFTLNANSLDATSAVIATEVGGSLNFGTDPNVTTNFGEGARIELGNFSESEIAQARAEGRISKGSLYVTNPDGTQTLKSGTILTDTDGQQYLLDAQYGSDGTGLSMGNTTGQPGVFRRGKTASDSSHSSFKSITESENFSSAPISVRDPSISINVKQFDGLAKTLPPVAVPGSTQPVIVTPPPPVVVPPTQPPVEEPPVEQPPVEQPPVEQPPVEQPPVEQPPVVQPPVEQPPVEQPPVEQPPVEQPPVEQPPVEQPPVEQPPVVVPPTQPPVEQPPVVQPPVEQPQPTVPTGTGPTVTSVQTSEEVSQVQQRGDTVIVPKKQSSLKGQTALSGEDLSKRKGRVVVLGN